MSSSWKPAISMWAFDEAPEELKLLSPFGVTWPCKADLALYVPKELCKLLDEDDWIMVMPENLWFISNKPKYKGHIQFSGECYGLYSLHDTKEGGIVVFTSRGDA